MAMELFIEITNKETGTRQWINPAMITRIEAEFYGHDKTRMIAGLSITLSGDPDPVSVVEKGEIASFGRQLDAKAFKIAR